MRQLTHSSSDDNIPDNILTCGEGKKLLNQENNSKYFVQGCHKNFFLVFISLKIYGNYKTDQFLVERGETFS